MSEGTLCKGGAVWACALLYGSSLLWSSWIAGKLGLGKEKIKITRKKLDQVSSENLFFWILIFVVVLFLSIRWRNAKTATLTLTMTLTLYSGGEEKQRRKMREMFGEDLFKNCQGYSEVSVSVSDSRLLPIFGGFQYQFRKIWSRKKISVFVLESLVSEISIGFGQNFGIVIQCC